MKISSIINFGISTINDGNKIFINIYSKITNVYNSFIGKQIIGSIQENLAEYVGYYALAALTGRVGNVVGGSVCKKVGKQMGYVLAVGAGAATGKHCLQENRKDFSHVLKVAILTTAVSGTTMFILPDALSYTGEVVGSAVGDYVGSLAGGILGGFAAIHYLGSQEVLWDQERPAYSYVTKTIQCMAAFMLLDLWRTPSEGVVRFVTDLTLGSLFYNALDILNGIDSFMNGQALDGLLSKNIDATSIVSRETVQQFLVFQAPQHLLQPEISKIVSQYVNASLAISPEPSTHLIDNQMNILLVCLIKGFNQYAGLIKQNTNITKAQHDVEQAFLKYEKEKEPVAKSNLKNQLEEAKVHLYKITKAFILAQDPLQKNLDLFLTGPLGQGGGEAPQKNPIQAMIDQQIPNWNNLLIGFLRKKEKKLLSFHITSDSWKQYSQEILQVHLPLIINLSIPFLLKKLPLQQFSFEEEEMRDVYKNISDLLVNHYCNVTKLKKINPLITKTLQHQIEHSKLA